MAGAVGDRLSGIVKADTIVIGTGLAGFAAAVALKRRNKQVAVLAKSGGATSVSSGAWDFGQMPWTTGFHKLLVDQPELGLAEDVQAAATETAQALSKDLKINFSFKRPYQLPTSNGTWKNTFGAQEVQARADLGNLKGRKIGVVMSEAWRWRGDLFLKKWLSDAEAAGNRLDISPVWLDLPLKGVDWPLSHFAARLFHDDKVREGFIAALEKKTAGENFEVLLFPPLFLDPRFPDELQRRLKSNIAETLACSEPVAGQRLSNAIRESLKKLSIPVVSTLEIRGIIADGIVKGLKFRAAGNDGWQEAQASSFVLATGKFFGGGIELGYHRLSEPIFDLPLYVSRNEGSVRYRSEISWTDHAFQEEQPWARLGLWVDAKWRPLDDARAAVLKNLAACGTILGGADFAREGLGLGFIAYSGRQAGNGVA